MIIAVWGNLQAFEELSKNKTGIQWLRPASLEAFTNSQEADAFINLDDDAFNADYNFTGKPVFIHAVHQTLTENQLPKHVIRINGWNGFLQKDTWEFAGILSEEHKTVAVALSKKLMAVPDVPGMVTARIISMIINEAFFACGEHVSTESEIDTAMKLGTNYPFGPFEWADTIGLKQILSLLQALQKNDARYNPAPLLMKKAGQMP